MKKSSLKLGLAAAATGLMLAAATSPATANKLWRFEPGQQEVQPEDCMIPSTELCANEYTDDGQFVQQIRAEYSGN